MEKSIEDPNPKTCTVKDVLEWIISKELSKKYHVAVSNCVFFANNLFLKFSNEFYPIEPEELRYEEMPEEETKSCLLLLSCCEKIINPMQSCRDRIKGAVQSHIGSCQLCNQREEARAE